MTIAGIRGRLVTTSYAEHFLAAHAAPAPNHLAAALEGWRHSVDEQIGPASGVRAIAEIAVIPLLEILGYTVLVRQDRNDRSLLEATAGDVHLPLVVVPFAARLDSAWRDMVLEGIRADAPWALCCNGAALRLVNAARTWTRDYLEFDLAILPDEGSTRRLWWLLLTPEAFNQRPSALDRMARDSAQHGLTIRKALGEGVLRALSLLFGALARGKGSHDRDLLFEQALTVLYRILFLLFAEARALVPIWHPVYRDRYTVNGIVTALLERRRYDGIWEAILAISRLAHAGCRAGELTVTPFNGRLFSPVHSTAFDRRRISDPLLGDAVLSVGTTRAAGRRTRISYADIDVEQLGAIYERVLEYEPSAGADAALLRTRDVRRATGSFYTPRAVTSALVRQTLAPLVRHRTSEQILELRVLDPAMGSGAFLVAACRFLAAAAEERLIEEGKWHEADVNGADRAELRRQVAQRCLYGVDINPMAVQLARLSLWLATLASDKPLTFLDHHLVAGDSLIGARIEDVMRQPMGGSRAHRRPGALPLFERVDAAPVLRNAVLARRQIACEPDDTPAVVAGKERALAAIHGDQSPLRRWARVLDLWCAGWFWETTPRPNAGVFAELCDQLLDRRGALRDRISKPALDHASQLSFRHRFFHWPLAFPEVFHDDTPGGFDAVIGNPPWDMIRGDSGHGDARTTRRSDARRFVDFVRESGVYVVESRAHLNRYQVFLERALQLTRTGGRIGLVLPSGVLSDAGSAPLRRYLFDRARIENVTGLDNRAGIFPIHRSLRFILMSAQAGTQTDAFDARFGIANVEELGQPARTMTLTRGFLSRVSGGDDLGVPDLRTPMDLRIVEALSSRWPWLGSRDGWNVEFGRELNATDDFAAFRPYRGDHRARPVVEGKQIEPFRVSLTTSRYEVAEPRTAERIPRRSRLAYRDVSSATNRLTLIAAIVPPQVVTTHTLFCLRTRLPIGSQHVLCALLNSLVANYLIRMRVSTHVTVRLVGHLPIPPLSTRQPSFLRLSALARHIASSPVPTDELAAYAELQAAAAAAYRVSREELIHILATFPLVSESVKLATIRAFDVNDGFRAGVR